MRFEKKFFFSKMYLNNVVNDFKKICNSINNYKVSSVYFDNINENCYHQKIDGDKEKIKIRARYYNNSKKQIKIEAKVKSNNKNYKLKTSIDTCEYENLLKYSIFNTENKNEDAKKIGFYLKYYALQRNIKIDYNRIEFSLNADSKLRFTIDYDIFYCDPFLEHHFKRVVDNSLCIFEIKTSNALIDRATSYIINKYNMKSEAISKFSLAIQAKKIDYTYYSN